MRRIFTRFLARCEGATTIEYAVILALILLVVLSSISLLGSNTKQSWTNINTDLTDNGFGS